MKQNTDKNTKKSSNELSRVFFIAHLLPIGLFTSAIFCGIFLVTACGPTKASTLKNPPLNALAPTNAQQTSGAISTGAMSGQDLIQKLSGVWDCVTPADPSGDCYGKNITFSAALDQMSLETMISLDDGSCHVQINYKTSMQAQDGGITLINMTDTQTDKLLDDPANAAECSTEFDDTKKVGLNLQRKLTHNAAWSQITFEGVTYARATSVKSTATASAETWINP
jgi:hypothetical protein